MVEPIKSFYSSSLFVVVTINMAGQQRGPRDMKPQQKAAHAGHSKAGDKGKPKHAKSHSQKPFKRPNSAPGKSPSAISTQKPHPKKRQAAHDNGARKKHKDNPETVEINQSIAQFASRKQFQEAQAAFDNAVARKLANSYTYVNMMNVCVRCGDMDQAWTVFSSMKEAGIKPDVVAYTTLLKGLCGEGQLTKAMEIVAEMEASKVPLNVRTVNTLLRGCILVGDVATAETIFDKTLGRWKLTPDASTWEYMIALLCRNLQLKKALNLFGKGILASGSQVSENSSTLLNLARAAMLLGDRDTAEKYIAITRVCLEQEEKQPDDDKNAPVEEGGKRGRGTDSASRKESLAVFLKIKRADLRRELTAMEAYNHDTSALIDMFKKIFLLPLVQDDKPLATSCSTKVLDSMGLRALFKKHNMENNIEDKFSSRLREESNRLRLRKVFGKEAKAYPLKIEICSGAGEWIVSQAKKDPQARWMAMEIRHDRVYQVFTHAVFSGVDNLCIVGGDAAMAIRDHLETDLADFIFINQPEPPQQTGGAAATTQAKHLLTQPFLTDCVQLLKPGGRLTIVTDNKWYATLFLKTVAKLTDVEGVRLKKQQTVESIGAIHIYMGHPPKECGVADEHSSSYFDRLAKHDNIRASQGTYFLSIARASS
ncbi:hypothetical protein LEN26_001951 [Aphanomyces euteiches]|nr:hypothetical protein LEN26_001951 [Aphanomyces euteiches]